MRNPFRLGIAHGKAFCNRSREMAQLTRNMRSGIHTVLYAPRRYGKSSLAMAMAESLEMVSIYIDLFSVTCAEEVAEKMYRGIVQELGRTAADKASLAKKVLASFKKLRLRLEFDQASAAPEFSVSLGDEKAEVHLEELIGSLDDYCQRQGIRVCLILDEFQEICGLKESFQIEALLRSGMQHARQVSFLMMGSRRTILKDMFEDKKRPFYKSAVVMALPAIAAEEFIPFLVERYADSGRALKPADAAEMIEFTNGYPYYVQKIAMLHFDLEGEGGVAEVKKQLLESESGDFESIYLGLTNHQKRLLRSVARLRPAEIHSQAFLTAGRLGSQGGVQTSLAKLKNLDLVEQRVGVWRVVDPILEKWLET